MFRWIGRALLGAAVLALVGAGVVGVGGLVGENADPFVATGLWWFQTHPDSLQLLQPAIERHVSVGLYANGVQPVLEAPFVLVLGVLGFVLACLGLLLRRN